MNVQEMTDRLKGQVQTHFRTNKRFSGTSPSRYIKDINVCDVDDDVAADYLEWAEEQLE